MENGRMKVLAFCFLWLLLSQTHAALSATASLATEADWTDHDFRFKSGQTLRDLRLHYRLLGTPIRNDAGEIVNAVLILHSTGSTSEQFLKPQFAQVLFGEGQPLDLKRYYIVIPDSIGHGKSSKPSDGLRSRFPAYDYDDMVAAQHDLLTRGLGIRHLRLVLGTSMGCMHSWVWAESYPRFMDTVMPLACLPAPVAGRNRIFRDIMVQAIQHDPAWNDGNYSHEPLTSLTFVAQMIMVASSGAEELQRLAPDPNAADGYLADFTIHNMAVLDANDVLYALNSSRDYDPSTRLPSIVAR